ncbi:MAG: LysM peptidoglycan-binding domain-containing protein [Balneolaceae bacterium]
MKQRIKQDSRQIVFLIVLLLSFTVPTGVLLAQETTQEHTTTEGETLFSVARQYQITVTELRNWNDLESDTLTEGLTLRVSPPVTEEVTLHRVEPGQTVYAISRMYGVSIAEIQQWNQIEDNILEVGQELRIYSEQEAGEPIELPVRENTETEEGDRGTLVSEPARANAWYTVVSGDNLHRIAIEHDMSVEELRQLNDLDSNLISVGQRLIVRQIQTTPGVSEFDEESTPQGRFVLYRLTGEDTLSSLKERFKMTEEELKALNPGFSPENLSEGRQITVLLPPNRTFTNPYSRGAGLEDLGQVAVRVYDEDERGSPTTSGELYNPNLLTAAHPNIALGTIIYIENPGNGRGVYVKVNDRFTGEGIKLSRTAMELLEFSSIERAFVNIYQEQ